MNKNVQSWRWFISGPQL